MKDHVPERTVGRPGPDGTTFMYATFGREVVQFEADGTATNITRVLDLETELRDTGTIA